MAIHSYWARTFAAEPSSKVSVVGVTVISPAPVFFIVTSKSGESIASRISKIKSSVIIVVLAFEHSMVLF